MYILLDDNSCVSEIIQDYDPTFPGVPISERYSSEFISMLLHVSDEIEVFTGWIYDKETGTFHEAPKD